MNRTILAVVMLVIPLIIASCNTLHGVSADAEEGRSALARTADSNP